MDGVGGSVVRNDVGTPSRKLNHTFGEIVVCAVALIKDVLSKLDAPVLENGATCSFGEDVPIIGVERK